MDFLNHSTTIRGKRHINLEVCVVYACVYMGILNNIVKCDNDGHLEKDVVKSKISVDYRDKSGFTQTEKNFEEGHYAENSRVNSNPIKGKLVYVRTLHNNSELGCTQINPDIVPKNEPWVALIKRGECDFSEKIYYAAKNSSASAVIIYNHEGSITIHSDDDKKQLITMTTATKGGYNRKSFLCCCCC